MEKLRERGSRTNRGVVGQKYGLLDRPRETVGQKDHGRWDKKMA